MELAAQVEQTEQVQQEQPTPQTQDSLAPKFAALAKKEKWVRKLLDDVSRQKKELEQRETEYKTNYVPKNRIKENFLEVALESGLTHDQIANLLLNNPTGAQVDPAIAALKAEVAGLKAELESTKTNLTNREKTQYDQAVAQVRMDAQSLLDRAADSFELLKTREDAADLITKYIEDTYREEGIAIKVEDAATFIEGELIEQASAMAKVKKVQEKAGLTLAQAIEQTKQQQAPQQQPSKTLTNSMQVSSKPLSAKDRRERAILAFQGKL